MESGGYLARFSPDGSVVEIGERPAEASRKPGSTARQGRHPLSALVGGRGCPASAALRSTSGRRHWQATGQEAAIARALDAVRVASERAPSFPYLGPGMPRW
jgi:hypothetical protein